MRREEEIEVHIMRKQIQAQSKMRKRTLFELGWKEKMLGVGQFIPVEKNNSIVVVQRRAEKTLQDGKSTAL